MPQSKAQDVGDRYKVRHEPRRRIERACAAWLNSVTRASNLPFELCTAGPREGQFRERRKHMTTKKTKKQLKNKKKLGSVKSLVRRAMAH